MNGQHTLGNTEPSAPLIGILAGMGPRSTAPFIDVPLLNIITETIFCLNRSSRTALLATRGTVDYGLYQAGFGETKGQLICRDDWQANVDRILLSIMMV